MRRIRITAFAVLAVLALSVVAVASASAHEFNTNKASGTVTAKSTTSQVFTTTGGKITCTSAATTGKFSGAKEIKAGEFGQTTLDVVVTYTGCEAFGLSATVSAAEYEISAEGTVKVLNTITVEPKSKVCHVTVTPTGNEKLSSVSFKDTTKGIEEKTTVTGINYEPSGSVCGTKAKETNGSYSGTSEAEVEGGTLTWK